MYLIESLVIMRKKSKRSVYYYGMTDVNGKLMSVYTAKPKRNDGFCIKVICCYAQRECMF